MTELKLNLTSPELAVMLIEVMEEFRKAQEKHPLFPDDIFKQLSILQEEVGEVAKDANDGKFEKMRTEIRQTIAVGMRMLMHKN